MSADDPGEQPEPKLDPAPEESPGAPADKIERDPDDFPLATPDQPKSAQVEQEDVPDEIEESEDVNEEEETDSDKSGEEPS
jgi:hypothetical protein